MLPLAIPAAASILAPVVGGAIGLGASAADRQKAQDAQRDALNAILGINVPTIDQQKINLDHYQYSGDYKPQTTDLVNQADSQMANINIDPRLKQAQMSALSQLGQLGEQGLSASDRAALMQTRRQTDADSNARQQSIMQSMQQRGMGGGGAELAMRLSAQQSDANRQGQQADNIASMAQQKALEAISQGGKLATDMNSQSFQQQADQARAQDYINQFNSRNRQDVNNLNTQMRNQAQLRNLDSHQTLNNNNVNLNNQQEMYNKNLYQTNFQNQMQKGNAVSGQYGNMAGMYQNNANQTQAGWAQMGAGVGDAVQGIAGFKSKSYDPYGNSTTEDNKKKGKTVQDTSYSVPTQMA